MRRFDNARQKPGKQPTCRCGNKIKVFVNDKGQVIGYGHKKKEHWLDRPHKAAPAQKETEEVLAS